MSSLGHTWQLSELKPPCSDSAAKVINVNLNPVTYWLAGEWRMIAWQNPSILHGNKILTLSVVLVQAQADAYYPIIYSKYIKACPLIVRSSKLSLQ